MTNPGTDRAVAGAGTRPSPVSWARWWAAARARVQPAAIGLVLRSLRFCLKMDGWRGTFRRAWVRAFSADDWLVYVRYLEPPAAPAAFPVEANGVTLRAMTDADIDDLARLLPFDLLRRPLKERHERLAKHREDVIVATRAGRIVGAALYADQVAEQPWYTTIADQLVWPARLTYFVFVVPGEKAAAWVIAKHGAGGRLPSIGIRALVSQIRAGNRTAILMAQLTGAKLAARMSMRHRWGRTTTVIERVPDAVAVDPQRR
jgi:hypothetical protein